MANQHYEPSNAPKRWRRCESMDHIGEGFDFTVAWRDLGLYCDTCFNAMGDTRVLASERDRYREALEAIERRIGGVTDLGDRGQLQRMLGPLIREALDG